MGLNEILSKIKRKKGVDSTKETNAVEEKILNTVEEEIINGCEEEVNDVENSPKMEEAYFYKFELDRIAPTNILDITFKQTNMVLEYETNEVSIDLTKKDIRLVEEKNIPLLLIEDNIVDVNESINGLLDEEYLIKSMGVELLDKAGNIIDYNFTPIELIECSKVPKGVKSLQGDVKIGLSIDYSKSIDINNNIIDIFLLNKPCEYGKELSYVYYNNPSADGFQLRHTFRTDKLFVNEVPEISDMISFNVDDISSNKFDIYLSCYGNITFNDVNEINLYIEHNSNQLYTLKLDKNSFKDFSIDKNTKSIKICNVKNIKGHYILNKDVLATYQDMEGVISTY